MTKLTRPIRRVVRGTTTEELVIELRPEGVMIREKGRRLWYGPLSYGHLLLDGARQYVEARKRERRTRRRTRKS